MIERTLIVFKPDSVERGLVGDILSRFERAGLRIVGSKTVQVEGEFVGLHYPEEKEFLRGIGLKTLENFAAHKLDPVKEIGTDDPLKIGEMIRKWNMEFLSRGPVIAAVLEGNHAVSNVRRLLGKTDPSTSDPGTIRGDYSTDSPILSTREKRSLQNLLHASGTVEEAEKEIKLWFKEEELI